MHFSIINLAGLGYGHWPLQLGNYLHVLYFCWKQQRSKQLKKKKAFSWWESKIQIVNSFLLFQLQPCSYNDHLLNLKIFVAFWWGQNISIYEDTWLPFDWILGTGCQQIPLCDSHNLFPLPDIIPPDHISTQSSDLK